MPSSAPLSIVRMGNPVLRKTASTVSAKEMLDPSMQTFVTQMIEAMYQAPGVGLAAPQVNRSIALFVMDPSDERTTEAETSVELEFPLVCFNPSFKALDSQRQGMWEGCLSIPGIRGYVERAQRIFVRYWDREAKEQSCVLEGFAATVFQHEWDHLQGKLFLDRISKKEKIAFLEEYLEFHEPHS